MDDSVHLRLFQRTLTGIAAKWYIELPQHSFVDFGSLATIFLTDFQLPIHYEMGTDLLKALYDKTPPPTYPIISMSGEGGED